MIVRISNKKSIKTGQYAGDNNISELKPLELDVQQIIKIENNKYAITSILKGGGNDDRKNIIYTYNSITGQVNDVTTFPLNGPTEVFDAHRRACIEIDGDGYILLTEEKGNNSSGTGNGHNTEIYVYKSDSPRSTASFTKIATISDLHTYPNIKNVAGTLFVIARGPTVNTKNVIYNISNLSNITSSVFLQLNGLRAYNRYFVSDDNWYYHAINERNDININWPNIHFLKTQNGITWYNVDESWSKSTTINQSEARANLLAVAAQNQNTGNVMFISGHINDSTAKMLILFGDNTGEVIGGNPTIVFKGLRWYYYENGWNYVDISSFFKENFEFQAARERYFISTKTADNEYIYVIDPDENNSVYEYKTKDNFQTYTKRKVLDGNGNYLVGNVSTKNISQKDIILCIYDTPGTWWDGSDFNFSANSNLIFIRP